MIELLERVETHLSDQLDGWTLRYYMWTDADLNGAADVALLRMNGTGGANNHEVQFQDVSLSLMCDPSAIKSTDETMTAILRHLRESYDAGSVINVDVFFMRPISYMGPVRLQNGRCLFEMVIRCATEDL